MRTYASLFLLAAAALAGCSISSSRPAAAPPVVASAPPADPRADFRPTPWEPYSPAVDAPTPARVLEVLCSDHPAECQSACRDAHDGYSFAECAVSLRYAHDREALELARRLLFRTGAVPGMDDLSEIDASYLGDVPVQPVLPVGPHRHHLRWVTASVLDFDALFAALAPLAPAPMLFRTRPHGFRFFATRERSYPSAYANDGVVAYNVKGALYDNEEDVRATLFHELFHLNDDGHGEWSRSALADVFDAIVARCGADDACLARFAPDDAKVPDGTYYAFDPRTGSVVEYAAEVALRWYREHHAIVREGRLPERPFKCGDELNREAWGRVTHEFFGGLDRVPDCSGS